MNRRVLCGYAAGLRAFGCETAYLRVFLRVCARVYALFARINSVHCFGGLNDDDDDDELRALGRQ